MPRLQLRTSIGIAVAAGVLFALIMLRRQDLLYVSIDGNHNLWLASAYRLWGTVFGTTAINPLEGMVSMQVAINPYFNPAALIIDGLPTPSATVAQFVIYAVELVASGYCLARSLGFSRATSLVGAYWLAWILLPPFNYWIGQPGWTGGAAMFANAISLSNVALTCVALLDRGRTGFRLILIGLTVVSLAALLLAAPFYNAGILPGFIVAAVAIALSSRSMSVFLWRAGAGLAFLVPFLALHGLSFFADALAYSARFSGDVSQNDWFSAANQPLLLSGLEQLLCRFGVGCGRWAVPVVLNGSYWLLFAAFAGGLIACAQSDHAFGRTGLGFAVMLALLLIFWLVQSADLVTRSILTPNFFLLLLYPFIAYFSLFAVIAAIDWMATRFGRVAAPRPSMAFVQFALLALLAIATIHVYRQPRGAIGNQTWQADSTEITKILTRDIALLPSFPYRGSVATIFGAPDGGLRTATGIDAKAPVKDIMTGIRFLQASRRVFGNEHDANDLWWLNVPTLFEYGQGVSHQILFYMQNFLSSPGDFQEIHRVLPRRVQVDVLRAMGVRYVITDHEQPLHLATSLNAAAPTALSLYLYELPDPNLGTFSPVRMRPFTSLADFAATVTAEPNILQAEAFIDGSAPADLVPATNAAMVFEKGAVHVTASSAGRSALLLPMQYSHCYALTGSQGIASIRRANLIHTLVVFEGRLDARLTWNLSLFPYDGCRGKDVADIKQMGFP